jgi:hypothetical protein
MRSLGLHSLDWRLWLETWGSSLALLPFVYVFATEGGGFGLGEALWAVVHAFDLIIHEAGHFFFRFFGRFMMIAGGSLLQLLLPALFVFQGVYWSNKLGTQLALLLLGQNFVDVSVYAADAQARALPLIGNLGPESHDWHNMLAMLGWLEHTALIAGAIYAMAFVCWGLMLLVPLRIH